METFNMVDMMEAFKDKDKRKKYYDEGQIICDEFINNFRHRHQS